MPTPPQTGAGLWEHITTAEDGSPGTLINLDRGHSVTEQGWINRCVGVSFLVAKFCPTLCDPMDCSTPDFPVHYLLEFAQTHVHWVRDAIQPSRPLSSPSPPAPNPSQIRVFSNESALRMRWPKYWSFSLASVLPKNTQDWSPLEWTGWISLQSKGLSRVFSNTTVQKHQFFGSQLSSQSNSHIHTWPLEKP